MSLQVGDTAPDFRLHDQHGRPTTLSSLRADRAVAVVFFPFVFSSVCTGELRELRDHRAAIRDAGAEVVGVSCDAMYSLRAYADQDGIGLPLLSDFWPHGGVARAFDVFDTEHGCATRSTFLVDREGVLRWTVHNPVAEGRRVLDLSRAVETISAS